MFNINNNLQEVLNMLSLVVGSLRSESDESENAANERLAEELHRAHRIIQDACDEYHASQRGPMERTGNRDD